MKKYTAIILLLIVAGLISGMTSKNVLLKSFLPAIQLVLIMRWKMIIRPSVFR